MDINTKEYKLMTADEQVELIHRVAEYTNNVLPALTDLTAFDNEQKEQYRTGIMLLSHFDVGRRFAHDAISISTNFRQHTNRMSYLFGLIKRNLSRDMQVSTGNGEQVIILAQSQSLRRGRPTAAESEQREREKRDAARAAAISSLTGARVATTDAAPISDRPSDTSRRHSDGPTLFDLAVDQEIEMASVSTSNTPQYDTQSGANACTVSGGSASELVNPDELKSLREWAWLLPDPLATNVKHLRETRNEIASEAEAAKRLFAQGAEQPVIAVHTQRAAELQREVGHLYAQVDAVLAYYFVMLHEVNPDFGGVAAKYEKHGGLSVLLNDLKPYFTKMSVDESWYTTTLSKCQRDNEDAIAAAQRDPEKEKALHKIKAYFARKDVKLSETRLARMKQYYADAQSLTTDADTLAGLKAILDATEADLNS